MLISSQTSGSHARYKQADEQQFFRFHALNKILIVNKLAATRCVAAAATAAAATAIMRCIFHTLWKR